MVDNSGSVTLGYWAVRGRAEVLRLLLEYTGQAYTEKQYTDFTEWFGKDKQAFGFDFPNLPYLLDGDTKLTETDAIALYIAVKGGKPELFGKDVKSKIALLQLKGVFNDLAKDLMELLHNKDYENQKGESLKTKIYPRLDNIVKYLGDKNWLLGDLSVLDLGSYSLLQALAQVDVGLWDKYPTLKALKERVAAIPELQDYLSSDRNKPRTFVGPTAVFNPVF